VRSFFLHISKSIDALINNLGKSVAWLTTILMLLICIDVVMRYLFSKSANWIVELEWHLSAVIFLIGASYTLLHDKHVRVDVFYEKFSSKTKDIVNVFGVLIFLIPWCIVLIYHGTSYAESAFGYGQGSSQPNGLPARYIIKAFIPLGFFLLLLAGISLIIKSITNKE